jgi:hypothetical protein
MTRTGKTADCEQLPNQAQRDICLQDQTKQSPISIYTNECQVIRRLRLPTRASTCFFGDYFQHFKALHLVSVQSHDMHTGISMRLLDH